LEPLHCGKFGATSLNDDLGRKRLLYERAKKLKEYWVIDVNIGDAITFADGSGGELRFSSVARIIAFTG